MADSMQHKEGDMMKNVLKSLAIGQTVTQTIIDQADKAGLPDAAMAQIWKGHTINRATWQIINDAVANQKPAPKPAEKKEGE